MNRLTRHCILVLLTSPMPIIGRLKTEMTIPVCAPGLLGGVSVSNIAKISALPLLHIATRPTAWQDWFAAHGACTTQVCGTVYDQFSTIIQAALHGLGVALLPNYLVEQDLATGRLIVAYGQSIKIRDPIF